MIDPKVRRRAVQTLRARREKRENELIQRRAQIYRRIPRIAEIDAQLKTTMAELAAAAFRSGGDPVAAVEKVKQQNLMLQSERAELLVGNGYPMDYLDDKPFCIRCGDTGRIGNRLCECFEELCAQEQIKELSNILDLDNQSFDKFDFSWYSEKVEPSIGMSPRENISLNYDICLEYARKFKVYNSSIGRNLFLNGGTGLGKTFLSACIAGEVAKQGFSVVYDSAINIMDCYEAVRFGRDDAERTTSVKRFEECDLLIVDDLGTEMVTAFMLSALYSLVNTRLIKNLHTVINSNLTMDEIRKRYTPQIVSRLEGEYTTLYFFGEDIRLLKRSRG